MTKKISMIQRGASWRLRIETNVGGKRVFTYETIKGTRAQAELRKAQLLTGVAEAPKAETNDELLVDYLCRRATEREGTGSLTNSSVTTYRAIDALIARHLASATIAKVTERDIVQCVTALNAEGYAARTVRMVKGRISSALSQAIIDGLRVTNPAKAVKTRKVNMSAGRIMTDDERARLLKAARDHYLGPVVRFALATGLRRGEIAALEWRHIDLAAGKVSVTQNLSEVGGCLELRDPKTASGIRTVSIPAVIVEELAALKEAQHGLDSDPVFLSSNARRWSPSGLTDAVSWLLKRARLEGMSIHDLRHCHASALLRGGANLRAVATRLGHADPSVTLKVYAHCLPNDDAALAEAAGAIFN
jgi:integrase